MSHSRISLERLDRGSFSSLCAVAVLAVTLGSCHESVVSAAETEQLHEVEPDDSSSQANWCGLLVPGSHRQIEGHISSQGPDVRDGYAFTAAAPCSLRFRLVPSLTGADLDLAVCDPALDAFTSCFDGTDEVEVGEVAMPKAGMDVHLVVCSAWASTGYSLEIEAVPLGTSDPVAARGEGKDTLARLSKYLRRNEPIGLVSAPERRRAGESATKSRTGAPVRTLAIGTVATLAPEFVSGFASAPK